MNTRLLAVLCFFFHAALYAEGVAPKPGGKPGEAVTAPVVTVLDKCTTRTQGVPKGLNLGSGFQSAGDYLYLSKGYNRVAGGVIQIFKWDAANAKLAYADTVNCEAIKSGLRLYVVGGRLYATGYFVWGANDEGKGKGLAWFDLEKETGKPVEKGALTDANYGEIVAGPQGKEIYVCNAGKGLAWFKLDADGKPVATGEVSGAGIGGSPRMSPDGRQIYLAGGHQLAVIDRKPGGEIAYRKAVDLKALVADKRPGAVSGDAQASLAGLSPDGRYLYVSLSGRQMRGLFFVFRRDAETGELALQETGSADEPAYSTLANLNGTNLIFLNNGAAGLIGSSSGLIQTFRYDANTGRLGDLSSVVLGAPETSKCRPAEPLLVDEKRGLAFGCGVWQRGSYGEADRGLWAAKVELAPAPAGDRADLKVTRAEGPARADLPDWPCWRGPSSDGKNATKGIRKDWTGGLRKVWEVSGLSPGDSTWSAPSVKGDKLLVLGTRGFLDELYCFDADKGGRPLWVTTLTGGGGECRDGWRGGPTSTPYVTDDAVYGACGNTLFAARLADGQVLWRKQVASACHGYSSSPLVWDDLVIATGVIHPDGKARLVTGLNRATGDVLWSYGEKVGSGDSPEFSNTSPARMKINGVEQVVYNTAAVACGLDPKTGKVLWEHKYLFPGCNVNATDPVTDGATVAILLGESKAKPFALQIGPDGPKTVWSEIPDCHPMWSDGICKDGYLYLFSADGLYSGGNSNLRCMDMKTGQPTWLTPKTGCGSMIEIDGCLLCLMYSGDLWLLEPSPAAFKKITEWKGALKPEPWWNANGGNGPAPCWTVPVVARGKIYLRHSNYLVCYDLMK